MNAPYAPPNGRWTPQAKEHALAALDAGDIDRAAFLRANDMAEAELAAWEATRARRWSLKVATIVRATRRAAR